MFILYKIDRYPKVLRINKASSLYTTNLSVFYFRWLFAIILGMRIVSGKYGGRPLKTLEGKTTRPTSDKVRGAMFNMIGPYFDGGRVLDLFAGSGGLSIEAVSRGMDEAVLVERDRKAQAIVQENIRMTKEESRFQLLKTEANHALGQLDGQFDLVFLDPPYALDLWQNLAQGVDPHIKVHGLIYVEADRELSQLGLPTSWVLNKQTKAGQVRAGLYQKQAST